MTTSFWRGRSTSIFLRLWTRAPRTAIQSWAMGDTRILNRSTSIEEFEACCRWNESEAESFQDGSHAFVDGAIEVCRRGRSNSRRRGRFGTQVGPDFDG